MARSAVLRERLVKGVALLDTLDYCREESGDPTLGAKAERLVVSAMLQDLALNTQLQEIDEELNAEQKGRGIETASEQGTNRNT